MRKITKKLPQREYLDVKPQTKGLWHLTKRAASKRCLQKKTDPESKIMDRLSRNLQRWVEEKRYYESYSSMEEIANELEVSAEQLRRFFLIRMHDRFSHWKKRLRLEDARILLRLFPDEPIEMIGIRVGINDKSNFRRQFFEEFGVYPADWRKNNVRRCIFANKLRTIKRVRKNY